MIEVLGCVAATASRMVLKTGTPCSVCPPLPGVTPATTFVPYSIICFAWKLPSRPVIPWTSRRVSLLTRIANGFLLAVGRREGRREKRECLGGRRRFLSSLLSLLSSTSRLAPPRRPSAPLRSSCPP